MAEPRILVVEDNAELLRELVHYLTLYRFETEGVQTVTAMRKTLANSAWDIVVLDLGLPDGDGLDALRAIREQYGLRIGVIVTTARSQVQDRIAGHSLGADAYLVKPVNLDELRVVIGQLVLRLQADDVDPEAQPWQIDMSRLELACPGGGTVPLTAAEAQLLSRLFKSPGEPISREDLCLHVATMPGAADNTRRLDSLVSRLRSKVMEHSGQQLPVRAFRNQGYAFTGPAD